MAMATVKPLLSRLAQPQGRPGRGAASWYLKACKKKKSGRCVKAGHAVAATKRTACYLQTAGAEDEEEYPVMLVHCINIPTKRNARCTTIRQPHQCKGCVNFYNIFSTDMKRPGQQHGITVKPCMVPATKPPNKMRCKGPHDYNAQPRGRGSTGRAARVCQHGCTG